MLAPVILFEDQPKDLIVCMLNYFLNHKDAIQIRTIIIINIIIIIGSPINTISATEPVLSRAP